MTFRFPFGLITSGFGCILRNKCTYPLSGSSGLEDSNQYIEIKPHAHTQELYLQL